MSWSSILCLIGVCVVAYLLGSVNFAIIITKVFSGNDIRDSGSGNAGMTNVLRTVGKGPAALVLLGDFSKGLLSVLLARVVFEVFLQQDGNFVVGYAAAFCALLGHIYPIFYKFRGGKGILVSSGALVMLAPIPFLISLGVFIVLVLITRIVSVGSIISAIAFPVSLFVWRMVHDASVIPPNHVGLEVFLASMIALLIVFMHRSNIVRLIHGEENKFGSKKK